MEVVKSILLKQLIMNIEARLEEIFKQLELFKFAVERGHSCESDFGNLEFLLIFFWKFAELLLVAIC